MGEESNGRADRIPHPLWAEVRPWGEDPEHSPPPMERRPDGELQVLESRISGQPGKHEGIVSSELGKDARRERRTESCRALQRSHGLHHLTQDLSEFRARTSAHKCLREHLLQIDGERCNTLMPLAGPAWLHSLLSDTC